MVWRALSIGLCLGFLLAFVPSCGEATQTVVHCNRQTCANGCCDDQGLCHIEGSDIACGLQGISCQGCGVGFACSQGVCRKAVVTKADAGTRNGDQGDAGTHVKPDAGAVSHDAGMNSDSGIEEIPDAGSIEDDAGIPTEMDAGTGCNTCIDFNGNCVAAVTDNLCGAGGSACKHCILQDRCVSGACVAPPCTAASCPNGCCDSTNHCINGTNNSQCGLNGSSCISCPNQGSCDTLTGICHDPCNATSCPNGCCSNDPIPHCVDPQGHNHCGIQGATCKQCPWYDHCDDPSGTCKFL